MARVGSLIINAFTLPFIKLDKIYPQVMKELEEREQSGKL